MIIKLDDEVIFELTETQKKILANDIEENLLKEDVKRRLKYILQHKLERCCSRLKSEWEPKLKKQGEKSIPLDEEEFARVVFAQRNYKDKKARVEEEKKLE